MTTAQDQQSRAEFEAWAKTMPAMYSRYMRRIGDGYETPYLQAAWNGWQAARSLPAGVTPVAKIHKGKLTWSIPWPEYSVDTALLTGGHDLFTSAQVLAMGRVPPCATCNDWGMIGGPSFSDPGEGGEPCPDCSAPTWEPKFDSMAPRQEELAVQFCNEISGPLGKPGRAPDPVRLLEMAEELYKAERDFARATREAS